MKVIFLGFLFAMISPSLTAQINDPVTWNTSVKKTGENQYEIHLTANVEGKWHIYSQDCGKGPEPTIISFSKNPMVKLVGKTAEIGKLESQYDPNFKSTLKYYNKQVDFVQKVTKKSKVSVLLKGNVSFMVCNEQRCLPPKDVPFSIKID